jgi:hypothetical protein
MDAETQASIAQLTARLETVQRNAAERIRWLSEQHEAEWRDAAAWRSQWTAELDALELEVGLLKLTLEQYMSNPNESQHERIVRKVNELTAAFAEVFFEMLPPDRQPLKERFSKALGDLLAEVIGGSTVMAAGVVVSIDKRVTALEEKQVGDDGSH